MKTQTKMKWISTLALILLVLTSCMVPPTQPAVAPVSTDTSQANMPNPASAYCVEQGFTSEIRTAADGSQSGVCIFPDGSECDEWAYFRGECGPIPSVAETAVIPTPTSTSSSGFVIPQANPMPAGAILDPRNDPVDMTKGLLVYNPDGLTLGELLAPRASQIHVAGRYQGSLTFPVVFHAFELETQNHYLNLNSGSTSTDPGGQISILAPLNEKDMLSGLVGVPGEPVLFYIVFQPLDQETLRSRFFVGALNSISTAAPVLTLDSKESRYWKPVAIQVKSGEPAGLWFTRHPWGIGGDIVFTPNEGLSYYDLDSGTITEVLAPEAQFNSLSTDQTWVAYSLRTETSYGFFIRNLTGGDPITIPTLPESDRGAGDGLFSPSNKYLAWREAQGSYFDGDFHQTIRIATLDGGSIGDFKDVSFYKTAEWSDATELKPLGWLDDESLLVQVVAPEKPGGRGAVVKLNVTTGGFSLFAQGFFAGWFYP